MIYIRNKTSSTRLVTHVRIMLCAAIAALCLLASTSWAAPEKPAPQFESQTFNDWKLDCEAQDKQTKKADTAVQDKRCFIFQNVHLQDSDQRILGVIVGNLGEKGQSILHVTVPLGVFIPAKVALKIGDGEQFQAGVQTCTVLGCEVVFELDEFVIGALLDAELTSVAFLDAVTRRQITVGLSMTGFKTAYHALKKTLATK